MSRIVLFSVAVLALGAPTMLAAQATSQNVITMTAHRVPFGRVDSLRKLLKETQPVLAEAKRGGGIVDVTWLVHAWGNDFTVVEMTTWKSWAAIETQRSASTPRSGKCTRTRVHGSAWKIASTGSSTA